MAKINLERYTEEDTKFSSYTDAELAMFKAYDSVMSDADKINKCEAEADKMFADAERLLSLSDTFESASKESDLTSREVQLLIKEADMVTKDYVGLSVNKFTQEDMSLDPKGTLMAASEDKRSIGRKVIDAAKKAIVKMIAMFKKTVAKIYAYFSVSSDAAKKLKEDIENWEKKETNTWYKDKRLDEADTDTIFERNLGMVAIRRDNNVDLNTGSAGYISLKMAKSILFKGEKFVGKVNLKDIEVPSEIDDSKEYVSTIFSVKRNIVRVLFAQVDSDGDYDKVKYGITNYTVSEEDYKDAKKSYEKIFTKNEVIMLLGAVASASKDTGKSIDKKFKMIKESEKDYDKAANEMKSNPSNDTKSKYNVTFAIYKHGSKIAFRQSLDMVAAIKDGLADAELYFEAMKKANKKSDH